MPSLPPLNITFLMRSMNYGGAERQVVLLVRELVARGHAVAVVVFYPGGPLEKELIQAGCRVESMGKRGRWDVIGFLPRLARALRGLGTQVLVSYLDVPNLVAAALKPLLPGAALVWGVRASNMDLSRYTWLDRLVFALEGPMSRMAEVVICNSQAGLEHVRAAGFAASRLIVIPNAIDTGRFRPSAAMRAAFRAELGLSHGDLLVGLVGRLDPMKDHPAFLKAAARLAKDHPGAHFVCVGDGPADYQASLRAQGEELGLEERLHWLPGRDAVEQVYNGLDLLCSASLYGEGFPNVVGEAMACGLPCVVTQVGDAPRVLGDAGRVVPPGDPAALAQALGGLLALPSREREALGRAARQRVEKNYSVKSLADRTLDAWAQGRVAGRLQK
ncbi:MAG: glycosyltransferase [Desulfarculaceae bacterium]|nr:glycosyltransferase [Desulfarculaceae bacterium]MCF8072918.1 glycosyltransferase [Desulfarculaceae bacterium]